MLDDSEAMAAVFSWLKARPGVERLPSDPTPRLSYTVRAQRQNEPAPMRFRRLLCEAAVLGWHRMERISFDDLKIMYYRWYTKAVSVNIQMSTIDKVFGTEFDDRPREGCKKVKASVSFLELDFELMARALGVTREMAEEHCRREHFDAMSPAAVVGPREWVTGPV